MNYIFSKFQDKQNPDRQGYILSKNNKELETLFYDIDKTSYLELVQKKKDFFNFVCSKYRDIDRRTLLLIFAYEDDDMLIYYKEQYPIEEKVVGKWKYKDCPKRTKRYYKKLTEDELIFVEVALSKYRDRLGYKVI